MCGGGGRGRFLEEPAGLCPLTLPQQASPDPSPGQKTESAGTEASVLLHGALCLTAHAALRSVLPPPREGSSSAGCRGGLRTPPELGRSLPSAAWQVITGRLEIVLTAPEVRSLRCAPRRSHRGVDRCASPGRWREGPFPGLFLLLGAARLPGSCRVLRLQSSTFSVSGSELCSPHHAPFSDSGPAAFSSSACDSFGPAQITQDNSPFLRSLVPSAKSFSLGEGTFTHVPETEPWVALGAVALPAAGCTGWYLHLPL